MGFFQTFWTWLGAQLATYIGDNTARLSQALEPAVVTMATVYVMAWGWMQMTGRSEQSFALGARRVVTLVLVLGVALRLWLYNTVIVDTFYSAPASLAAAVVGSSNPVGTIDTIWQHGGAVADLLWNKGGVFNGDAGFYLAGVLVWILMGLLCVYIMFLICLSGIALAVLLAIGPLFVVLLLFDGTRRLFESWLLLLANYALVTILTVLLAALLLQVVDTYAAQTAALGSAILTVDALDMLLVATLVLLVMRQVMPIAASLTGGGSLTTMGALSRSLTWVSRQVPQ